MGLHPIAPGYGVVWSILTDPPDSFPTNGESDLPEEGTEQPTKAVLAAS